MKIIFDVSDCKLYFSNFNNAGIFIRAPGIVSINDPTVEVLAKLNYEGEDIPVAVSYSNSMVTAFHPELTNDSRFHEYFVRMIVGSKNE